MSMSQQERKDEQRIHAATPKRRSDPSAPQSGDQEAEVQGHMYDPNDPLSEDVMKAYRQDREHKGAAERLAGYARQTGQATRGLVDRIRRRINRS